MMPDSPFRYPPGTENWLPRIYGTDLPRRFCRCLHLSCQNDVSVVGHLRAYRDLSESTNMDVGASVFTRHNLFGTDFITHLYGVDCHVRWKPLQRSIYHSFVARSEFIWRSRTS